MASFEMLIAMIIFTIKSKIHVLYLCDMTHYGALFRVNLPNC